MRILATVSNKISNILPKYIEMEFEKFLPTLKDTYLDTYDKELSATVTDRNSLANPEYFYDDYKDALEDFEYTSSSSDEEGTITFYIPSEDTFDFSGRMGFIQLIVNGTSGKYYELSQEDFEILSRSRDIDEKVKRVIYNLPEFFTSTTPKEFRFYLVPSTGNLYKTIQGILGKKLILFPFSNKAPINIFEDGEDLFEDKIEDIISEAIDKALKEVKRSYNV